MKKSTTRRALLLSFASMFLCFTMLLGTTYAWFTDSVESDVNKIVAGNLDIELEYYDGTDWESVEAKKEIFDPKALWEPGYAEIVYLRVTNKGNLAFNFDFSLNVLNEIKGMNKSMEEIRLSKYLKYGVTECERENQFGTNRADAIAAVANKAVSLFEDGKGYADTSFTGSLKEHGESKTFAIIIWMPTDVGNEANYNSNYPVPEIHFGLNAYATQKVHEKDSFGPDYDLHAFAPTKGEGSYTYDPTAGLAGFTVEIRDENNNKIGAIEVPTAALEDVTAPVEVKGTMDVSDEANPGNLSITSGYDVFTYGIHLTNIKEGNTEPLKVMVRLDKGLAENTIEVHHCITDANGDVERVEKLGCTYNPYTGYVTFLTTNFSPFTFVSDPASDYETPITLPEGLPKATVVKSSDYENVDLPWGSYGQWSPTSGLDSQLEAAYTFSCAEKPEEAKANAYANWNCDFYVKLDRDLGENQIFLGGNYGSFGWVGFHNGDLTLEANTEIPLLGSVTTTPWTYEDVANYVGTFICGVGDVDDALKGATFTVMLRLTNPEDESVFYNVATINYTFE